MVEELFEELKDGKVPSVIVPFGEEVKKVGGVEQTVPPEYKKSL